MVMSIVIGTGVIFVVATWYVGKKSWHALHRMVGITPGTMVYTNPYALLTLKDLRLQQLTIPKAHLQNLSEAHLTHIQRIDDKISLYQQYYKNSEDIATHTVSEQHIILHKLMDTRLPEMLRSYHLQHTLTQKKESHAETDNTAVQLLTNSLQGIEAQLDAGLQTLQQKHLDDLHIMNRYIDEHKRL